MPAARQFGPLPVLGLWAAFTLAGTLYASWLGYGGRAFAATLTAFAFYFLVMLLFAARGISDSLASRLGLGGGFLLGSTAFLVYLIYVLGTNTFTFGRAGIVAGLVFLPLTLAASAERNPPGHWQDFLILSGVWVSVTFLPSHWLWAYPGGRLSYVFTILLCVNATLGPFLLIRRVAGVGYSVGWGPRWGLYIAGSFLIFGCIAIPLGTAMHFIQFAPRWDAWKSLFSAAPAILLFTAWPEEFFFRGLLQNMLSRVSKSDLAGWWTASVIFGLSHITKGGFPNWRYVLLASIAGIFYGWTWRKTCSIFASAIVHAAVDLTWHFLFRTI